MKQDGNDRKRTDTMDEISKSHVYYQQRQQDQHVHLEELHENLDPMIWQLQSSYMPKPSSDMAAQGVCDFKQSRFSGHYLRLCEDSKIGLD